MPRGQLRVYLGAAPGVGKTYTMLDEGRRRLARGTDVVVGLVETHGRARTAELLDGLEVVPRRVLSYRGASFTEMDIEAVLARHPQVALVDELAHTNVPGCTPRQTLAGRPRAARRRHHRDHHGQHPAPGIGQRRRRSRSPACRSGRPSPTRSCAGPTRSSWST